MKCQPDPRVTWLQEGWNQCKVCFSQFFQVEDTECHLPEETSKYEPPMVPPTSFPEPEYPPFDPDFDYMGAAKNYQLAKKSGELII